jgi:arginase family enzyme
MQKISLIPYACGAGAENQDCASGPLYLKENNFTQLLRQAGTLAEWLPEIISKEIERPLPNKVATVAAYCELLKQQVQDVLLEGGLPISIGGDHAMAIGTWTGVADCLHTRRKLGLIWIDAHMDAHTAETSHSGNRHGMPISYLLGYGDDELVKITKAAPVIVPSQLCLIGVRSFEPEEEDLLNSIGAKFFTMAEVRAKGLNNVMLEAVKIASAHTAGFGISIDVDAFDPKIAPGTGTVASGGLLKEEFINAVEYALHGYRQHLLALEIAEYNPKLDKGNITAQLMADIIAAIIKI